MALFRLAFLPLPAIALSLLPARASAQAAPLSVTTLAASAAQLFGPEGVAADPAGNLYISMLDNTIRKVSPQGKVTILAGSPSQFGGYADGTGSAAEFSAPRGLAVDSAGDVYVADSGNYAVRKITPDGGVTTIAGPSAGLANPTGVAVDSAGDVYVADDNSATIRKIAPDGSISLLAGKSYVTGSTDGAGPNARFDGPVGLSIDAAGRLYVADSGNHAIRTIDAAGNVATLATGIDDPAAVAVDASGEVYVANENDSTIVAISPSGATAIVAGVTGARGNVDGIGSAARLTVPCALSFLPDGDLAIADWEIDAVRLAAPAAHLVNVSTRAYVGAGQDVVAGFVVAGSGAESVLIRGVGPTLASFGVTTPLAQPEVTLFDPQSAVMTSQAAWGGDAAAAQAELRVGAFPLPANSADAAFIAALPAGAYTAQASGLDGASGVALIEIYDAGGSDSPNRLVNLSTRAYVGTGSNALVAGFVVAGSAPETLLVRGIGPTLGQFGIADPLPAAQLTVYDDNSRSIAANAGWGGDPALSAAFAKTGAFALPADSADAAVLVTLLPGAYTAEVSGQSGATGVGMVEVYDVP
ncbi:MAG: hypothetical protein ACREFX_12720 [Opitutaceae bacterium]